MSTQEQAARKQFYIVTGQNFAGVEVEFFTDPLAYGRAVKETERQHARGEVDAYTHGDNMVNNDRKNPVYGSLYIASMGELGADVEFFADETEYLNRLLDYKEDRYYERVDALSYNGRDVEFDPHADELEDDTEEAVTAAAP